MKGAERVLDGPGIGNDSSVIQGKVCKVRVLPEILLHEHPNLRTAAHEIRPNPALACMLRLAHAVPTQVPVHGIGIVGFICRIPQQSLVVAVRSSVGQKKISVEPA